LIARLNHVLDMPDVQVQECWSWLRNAADLQIQKQDKHHQRQVSLRIRGRTQVWSLVSLRIRGRTQVWSLWSIRAQLKNLPTEIIELIKDAVKFILFKIGLAKKV
jgi:hypothetical protein